MNSIIDRHILTQNSKMKFRQLYNYIDGSNELHYNLINLLDVMLKAFYVRINFKLVSDVDLKHVQNEFISFDKTFNYEQQSKFKIDVSKMNKLYSFDLIIATDRIRVNVLCNSADDNSKYIVSILYALHIFCYTFTHRYDGLTIDVSLDNNRRDIDLGNKDTYSEVFDHMHRNSAAFNVSGVTNKSDKHIIVTKREEIIKLLYHELVHYVGLDSALLAYDSVVGWAISEQSLNLSEAYTEFMSILLYSAYQSIQIYSLDTNRETIYDLYSKLLYAETQYSVYLTGNIFKFYGYNYGTYGNFFNGVGQRVATPPISIWEYIVIRTQLLLNLNQVAAVVGYNWRVTASNIENLQRLMKIDNNMMNSISKMMKNTHVIPSISYTLIDLNWNTI